MIHMRMQQLYTVGAGVHSNNSLCLHLLWSCRNKCTAAHKVLYGVNWAESRIMARTCDTGYYDLREIARSRLQLQVSANLVPCEILARSVPWPIAVVHTGYIHALTSHYVRLGRDVYKACSTCMSTFCPLALLYLFVTTHCAPAPNSWNSIRSGPQQAENMCHRGTHMTELSMLGKFVLAMEGDWQRSKRELTDRND